MIDETENLTTSEEELRILGWQSHFDTQIDAGEFVVRVMALHRGQVQVAGVGFAGLILSQYKNVDDEEDYPTTGDWIVIDPNSKKILKILDRKSLFKRRAPGRNRQNQLIAANVDTVFVTMALDHDFNVARLERYLVVARDAGVEPVIVLTKLDLVHDADEYITQVRGLGNDIEIAAINAKEAESSAELLQWCGFGQTVALLGSSGVGKSTLVNTLIGEQMALTQDVRDKDSKGRHTTTTRSLHRLPAGGWLMDTPGMRELQLTDAAEGVSDVFADIIELSASCKFNDCAHNQEPKCAVRAAVDVGELDAARLERWRKLDAEDSFNSMTIQQRRVSERVFGKMVKTAINHKKKTR